MVNLDLSSGSATVIGNRGDEHSFRFGNPAGQQIIVAGATFEAEFVNAGGTATPVEPILTELETGYLTIPIVIANGRYNIRRLNPRRTVFVLNVEAK